MPHMTQLFIPVPLKNYSEQRPKNKVFNLTEFVDTFDYDHLANDITELCSKNSCQVGTTYEEAEAVANQHALTQLMLVVELHVPASRVPPYPACEAQLFPSWMNAHSKTEYFYLLESTKITANNIVSVRPMRSYTSTMPVGLKAQEDELWPNHPVLTRASWMEVFNPMLSFAIEYPFTSAALFSFLVAAFILAAVAAAAAAVLSAVGAVLDVGVRSTKATCSFFGTKATPQIGESAASAQVAVVAAPV